MIEIRTPPPGDLRHFLEIGAKTFAEALHAEEAERDERVLDPERLSKASRISMERAIDWWQKSMLTSKHKTYFVLAGYDIDQGQEIKLRRAIIE